QLINDSIVKFILRELDLPLTNLIYNSGGNFYILAPTELNPTLGEIRKVINEIIFKHHKGDIYCALANIGMSVEDFSPETSELPKKWAELGTELGLQKRRKFADMAVDKYADLFEPQQKGGSEPRCDICKEERELRYKNDLDHGNKCYFCWSFENLGQIVGRSHFLIEADITDIKGDIHFPKEEGEDIYLTVLADFGVFYRFTDKKLVGVRLQELIELPVGPQNVTLLHLNETDFLSDALTFEKDYQEGVARGFKFLANTTPWAWKKDEPGNDITNEKPVVATFEDLAEKATGVKRWACLRMDVDSLGDIFKYSFKGRSSLSRAATLSAQFSLFFEGYINEVLKEFNKFDNGNADHIYVIYSGGDDSCIVGSWDKLVDAAHRIYKEFREFSGRNSKVTLSGGISLHKEKYPMYKAADTALNFLESAKNYEHQQVVNEEVKKKDAFTFLGRSLSWTQYEVCIELKDILLKMINGKDMGGTKMKLSRGFLQKLLMVYYLYEKSKKELLGKTISLAQVEKALLYNKWRWRLVYNLSKESGEFKEELDRLQSIVFNSNHINLAIDYLNVPVRWVELLTREKED
ncbi:MAG: type III-A CRISPR-associated protein Cas10/Csm1, partial [Deltaproteobacteria bacterium]|nr:type III-A CRISPR-associated protein Cas10/Csm1 [Deltaproteobacteria bacterium]